MKNIKPYLAMMAGLALLQACKKEDEKRTDTPPPAVVRTAEFKDSVTFTIDGRRYTFTGTKSGGGMSNSAVNVKSSPVEVKDKKLAGSNGNTFWYGSRDSTMYTTFYLWSSERMGQLKVGFAKVYNDKDLVHKYNIIYPTTNLELIKVGEAGIATDLGITNTVNGFYIDLFDDRSLKSRMEGYPGMLRPSVPNDLQKDAKCTVTKVEDMRDGTVVITATFELKMVDDMGKIYDLKNGYIQTRVQTNPSPFIEK